MMSPVLHYPDPMHSKALYHILMLYSHLNCKLTVVTSKDLGYHIESLEILGIVAQLGERYVRNVEVEGSSPFGSIRK